MKKMTLPVCLVGLLFCAATINSNSIKNNNYWADINDLFQKLDQAHDQARKTQEEIAFYSEQISNFDAIFFQRDQLRQEIYNYVNKRYDTLAQAIADSVNKNEKISSELQTQIVILKVNIQNLIDQTNQQIIDLQNNVNDLTNQLTLLQAGYQTLQQLNTAKAKEVLFNVQQLHEAYNSNLNDRQNFVDQLNKFLIKVLALEATTQQESQALSEKICNQATM